MRLNNFGLAGLIGTLIFLAGADLLWKSRAAAIAWLREFVCILRGEFAVKTGARRESPTQARSGPGSGALILVAAVALIVLGQILFLLDLIR